MSDYQIVLRFLLLARALEDTGQVTHDDWDVAMAALTRLAHTTKSHSQLRRERAMMIEEAPA